MQARLELPPEGTSPRRARRFAAQTLTDWGFDELIDVAGLLVTELVTNAVLHAGTPLVVTISTRARVVRIGVTDASRAVPRPRRHSLEAATGRGLRLVAEMSTGWGTEPTKTGKQIWFELTTDGPVGRRGRASDWADERGATWVV